MSVGEDRGFVVAVRHRRCVVTAACCLPRLPPSYGFGLIEERAYKSLPGPLDQERQVWAECLFADPIGDLAVLGSPDIDALPKRAVAYDALVSSAERLTVAEAPQKAEAWRLSLASKWLPCSVEHSGRMLWLADAAELTKAIAMPERIRAKRVAEITGLTVRRVQELAIQCGIPSAAQLGGKMWTFNEARVRRWIEELEEANVREAARLKETLAYRPARFDGPRMTSREIDEAYERALRGDNWDPKKTRKPGSRIARHVTVEECERFLRSRDDSPKLPRKPRRGRGT